MVSSPWYVGIFSIGGADPSIDVVHYVMYDFTIKVTNLSFNIAFPILITTLGDQQFGNNQGRIILSYTIAVSLILTAISFITFTTILEYGHLKRKILFQFSCMTAAFHLLFFLCFNPGAIYLACALSTGSRVCQAIASVAYDALLDAISRHDPANKRDPHAISSRAFISGYVGILLFFIVLVPVLSVAYFALHLNKKWVQGIIPAVVVGIWYSVFLRQVEKYLPKNLGKGLPLDDAIMISLGMDKKVPVSTFEPKVHAQTSSNPSTISGTQQEHKNNSEFIAQYDPATVTLGGDALTMPDDVENVDTIPDAKQYFQLNELKKLLMLIKFGFIHGIQLQYENVLEATTYVDLSLLIVAFIFIAGAATTSQSVVVIIATEILHASIGLVAIAAIVLFIAAIFGLIFFKFIVAKQWLSPKHVIIINIIIIMLTFGAFLFVSSPLQLLIIAAVIGFQLGPVGAFSKSIVSSFIPTKRQSRLFSLFQFSLDSTSWIGNVVIASIAQTYGGSNRVYLRTVVGTCLVELAIGLLLFSLINYKRGVEFRKAKDGSTDLISQTSKINTLT